MPCTRPISVVWIASDRPAPDSPVMMTRSDGAVGAPGSQLRVSSVTAGYLRSFLVTPPANPLNTATTIAAAPVSQNPESAVTPGMKAAAR